MKRLYAALDWLDLELAKFWTGPWFVAIVLDVIFQPRWYLSLPVAGFLIWADPSIPWVGRSQSHYEEEADA